MAMSVKEILELDLNDIMRMGLGQLTELNRILVSAANKRIKRYQQAKEQDDSLYSQVIESRIKLEKGKFTSANLNALNKARKTFFEATDFLRATTSTLRGTKKTHKQFEEFMGKKGASKEEIKDFERLLARVLELRPDLKNAKGGRTAAAKAVNIAMDHDLYDPLEIANHLEEILDNTYDWELERKSESPQFDGNY